MSECAVPGRTLLLPTYHGVEGVERTIAREIGLEFRFEYGIEDVVRRYDARMPEDAIKRHGPLPLVARVPEGTEMEASARLARSKHFEAAMPDFLVQPQASVVPAAGRIAAAVAKLTFDAGCETKGEGCTVAVLDTGVDGSQLPNPASLHSIQYDVRKPDDHGSSPQDTAGHGTLVAHIVNAVAPAAQIFSIKTIRNSGSVSDVLSGMYLSQALGRADVLNLSLRILCQAELCAVCKTPGPGSTNTRQLGLFFEAFQRGAPDSVIVAAAGNGSKHLSYPAALSGVIAVGSFDDEQGEPAAVSAYHSVPPARYVLATGGKDAPGWELGSKSGHRGATAAHGTSFATAFISGLAAQFVSCDRAHGRPNRNPGEKMTEAFLRHLATFCYRGWNGFDEQRHGLGAAA